jgi:glycerol-3-phosphate acyltransferase PlsY
MLWSCIALVVAYLLGSVSGSLLLGRLVGVDIRTRGSGNAGGTNAFRTLGWKFALGVVAVDAGKGALAAWLGLALHRPDSPLSTEALGFACGAAAAIGHTWPIFFGFRGGKGAATLVGGIALMWPIALLPLFLLWLLVLTSTGYVGLATICAGVGAIAVACWDGARELADPRLGFALFAAAFLLFTHRANVARLLAGNEHRFERARIWKRWFGSGRA